MITQPPEIIYGTPCPARQKQILVLLGVLNSGNPSGDLVWPLSVGDKTIPSYSVLLTLTLLDLTKIVQKLSPKHAARGVAQSPYPTYRHGKAGLSKQPPWRAAGDPRLPRGRSRVRAPGPAGAAHPLFFSTLPSFLLREIVFSHLPHLPQQTCG